MKCSVIRLSGASNPQVGQDRTVVLFSVVKKLFVAVSACNVSTLARFARGLVSLTFRLFDFEIVLRTEDWSLTPCVFRGRVLSPERLTINRPKIAPANTPNKNSKMIVSMIPIFLTQRNVRVTILSALSTNNPPKRSSLNLVDAGDFSSAVSTDNNTLAHSL
jgi:hypothetical protein